MHVIVTDFLGRQLEEYCAKLPVPVHVERMGTRSGLIRARLRGKIIYLLLLPASKNLEMAQNLACWR